MWPFRKKNYSIISLANAIWGEGGGASLSAEGCLRVADIYSCVRVLSNTMASLPLSLHYADIKRGKDTNHPYHKLVHRKPNSWMTPSSFRRLMTVHLALRGNFYAYKNIVAGEVRELNPIHPDSIAVEQLDDLSLRYKVQLKNGSLVSLTGREVLHISALSMDGITGLSVVKIMADLFGYAYDAQKFQNRALRNGAKPSGLLVFPDALKEDQYQKEVERIQKAAGGENAGSTLILDRGVEFKKVSLTASDLMLLDSMKLSRSQICGVMGVPPHMIGDLDRATFSNIEHQAINYYVSGIMPLCVTIEDGLNLGLLDGDITHGFKFNATAILRGDAKSRMEAHQLSIMNGIQSPDEVREIEDMAPRPDGMGGIYYYPANLLPAGTKPKQAIESKEGK